LLKSSGHEQMSDGDRERAPLNRGRELELASRVARFWWIGIVRGTIALALGSSALLASGTAERLATFLALYWLAGGIVTIRFAWAVRPTAGFRLAWVAGAVAITAALLVALREFLSGVVSPATVIDVLGFAAVAMGTLRLVGAFEIERRTSHRWSIGGLVLGGLELVTGIILLVAADTQSSALMITVGSWALASGTLLMLEAVRARRVAHAILGSRDATAPSRRIGSVERSSGFDGHARR
jgi:uncharacterized membrane protein HdeD (DUF308 family)